MLCAFIYDDLSFLRPTLFSLKSRKIEHLAKHLIKFNLIKKINPKNMVTFEHKWTLISKIKKISLLMKLKHTLHTGLLAVVLSILLSACSSKSKNIDLIPKDAVAVGSIDFHNMANKGAFDGFNELNIIKMAKEELKNETEGKKYQAILENPNESGINFDKEIFVFGLMPDMKNPIGCISMELSNKTKFEELLKSTVEGNGMPFKIEKKEGDSFSYFNVIGMAVLAWDSDKVLLLGKGGFGGADLVESARTLFTQNSENQLTSDASFSKFIAEKKDINIWGSTNFLGKMTEITKQLGFDMTGNYVSYHLGFDHGKISMTGHNSYNKETTDIIKDYDVSSIDFNKAILSVFPENQIAGMAGKVNFKKYLDLVMTQLGDSNNVSKDFEKQFGISMEDLSGALAGNMALSVYDFVDLSKEYTYSDYNFETGEREEKTRTKTEMTPLIGMSFDLKDEAIFTSLIEKNADKIEKVDTYYQTISKYSEQLYFAMKDKILFASNDKEKVMAFSKGNTTKDNLSTSAFAKKAASEMFYGMVNLDLKSYPEAWKREMRWDRNKELQTFDQLFNQIEMKVNDMQNMSMDMQLGEDNKNALNTIIKTIDSQYGQLR